MRSRKIISIMAIALAVVITSCTIGDTAYAAEIQNTQSINTEVKLNSKTNSEFAKTLKIVDSNISFNEGYYSFNKTNAIKQGLSADKADSVVECINEVNSQIENGMLKVSADGKNVIANSNSNNFNINKDSKIMTSSYDDDDYDVIYEGYLSVDACNAIGDDLNDGATWIGLACALAV